MKKIVEYFVELPKWMHRPLWRLWHNLILKFDKNGANNFLNYGYAGAQEEFAQVPLTEEQERQRYPIQLYCHTAGGYIKADTDVLEVGCGRGGGAAFLCQTFQPKSYIGLDLNAKTMDYCNKQHHVSGLRFVTGDAQSLPFENESFDIVINVESARCYPDMERFFCEVYRVLKPGGKFLYADMIKPADVETVEKRLSTSRFQLLQKTDIRQNIVAGLRADSMNRKSEIDRKVPGFLHAAFYEFAGVEGSNRFRIFDVGEMGYWSYQALKA